VQVRINLQKGSIAGLKQQLESEHAKAADLEQSAQPVTADIQKKMEELRASIAEEEARMARLEQDRSTVAARYQFDIERFRSIRSGSR
jgi:molecular chaperone GrpE (heat shock protein)